MGQSLLLLPPSDKVAMQTSGYMDDLEGYVTGDRFTALAADAGSSVARTDAANGVVALTTGGTDNNEAAIRTSQEVFLFAADKPIYCVGRFQYAEAATNAANVAFGLADAVGANLLLDDGAGPKASYSGALLYKVDGETTWRFQTSIGSTKTTTVLSAANTLTKKDYTAGGSGYVVAEIEFSPITATVADISLKINGEHVVKHAITFTSATEMHQAAYVKAGSANSQVLNVDLLGCRQSR